MSGFNESSSKGSNTARQFVLGAGCMSIIGLLILIVLSPAIHLSMRARATRMQCPNNIKTILLALHNYHDVYQSLPPAYTTDEDGNPLHSWRVLLLPFIEQGILYDSIRLDEPWDSEYNKQFHELMPSIYFCPSSQFTPLDGFASYNWVVGPDTISDGTSTVTFHDVSAGLSNTICVVEVVRTTCWMAPLNDVPQDHLTPDLTLSPKTMGIGSRHTDGMNVGYMDGSVEFMPNREAPQLKDRVKIKR